MCRAARCQHTHLVRERGVWCVDPRRRRHHTCDLGKRDDVTAAPAARTQGPAQSTLPELDGDTRHGYCPQCLRHGPHVAPYDGLGAVQVAVRLAASDNAMQGVSGCESASQPSLRHARCACLYDGGGRHEPICG